MSHRFSPSQDSFTPAVLLEAAAPLDAILCTERLRERPNRPPDYEAESRALTMLVQALADSPSTILQRLADTILEALKADSAGVSLLAPDGKSFYWPAIAGAWQPHLGGGTPRDFGPCGDVLDRNTPLLFTHWERRYPHLLTAMPLAEEGLLVPFYAGGKAIGTIWAIAHDETRKFDAEDLRLLESLGRFASAAHQALENQRVQEAHRATKILMEEQAQFVEKIRESELHSRTLLNALPAAIYTTDADGFVQMFNTAAVDLAGRTPVIGRDQWCVTWRLHNPDGTSLPHEQCPMAVTLKERRAIRGYEVEVERPDRSRLPVMAYPTPLHDATGKFVGAVNMLVDISELKHARATIVRRMEELHALYKFTDILSRVEDIEQIYTAALEVICSTLECSKASVLLFDADNVMRFAASRGLSQQYRDAVEGHSPWSATDRDPQPICISNVESSRLDEVLKATLKTERIAALSFIPLTIERRLIGKFMTYYDAPHDFNQDEVDLAATIARHLGFAMEKTRSAKATRAAERALQESTSRKSAILESALDAIVAMDQHGKITDFNPAAARLFGYDAKDMIGKSVADTIVPERLRDAHRRGLERFLQSGQGQVVGRRVEMPARRCDGSEVDVELSIAADRLSDGSLQFIACVRDITERKCAEQSMQRLATIVDSSGDAIISKGLDGIIQTWNGAAERMYGYKAEEVIGKPVTMLMPPDRFDEEPGIVARLRRGERIDHYETVRRRKDGTLIDVSLTVSPVKDHTGRVIGASKIARDITERKRAEAALRENERRLQDLLAAIPAAVYTTDAAGKITYYNEAAVEFSGRRPTIGSDEWCVTWKMYWPDGTPLPHDECPMAIALKEGRAIRGKEAVAERPDGTRVPFIPFPTPLYDAGGKLVGAINMLVDISERKQAETQQRVLLRELNHRVKNNMQMLQSLLYTATRQTQNQEARKVLDDAVSRISAMASAQRVLYQTNDTTRFSTQEFLDAVCQTAQQTFPPSIKIICEASEGELDNDNAMPLALILNELLTNAVKHGCDGKEENSIRVGLTNGGDGSVLYVEDEGPGFELESVIQQSSGLKLVQLLARQLHGQLEVIRKPFSRCTVRFH